jgi:hypothetical protein
MKGRFRNIVKELIIGFGFLNGLWFAIGTSPETEILGFINRYIDVMPATLQKIVLTIPIVLTIATILTIISIYRKGRILGSIAIFLAFIAGAIVLQNWKTTIALLLASMILALISFRDKGTAHKR